jgi:hypothetical protein
MRFERPVMKRSTATTVAVILALGGLALAGCASKKGPPPISAPTSTAAANSDEKDGHWLHLFSPRAPKPAGDNPVAIGVNAYLWRASLDVLNFMPLTSADPYGGLIVTDWYVNPEKIDERFKVNVYILDTRLRADGINVSVNRQVKGADGSWVNAPTSAQTESAMEDAILARARSLRIGAD